jgi:hypothetical protein
MIYEKIWENPLVISEKTLELAGFFINFRPAENRLRNNNKKIILLLVH